MPDLASTITKHDLNPETIMKDREILEEVLETR